MLISEDGPCWIGHDKFPVLRCCMWTGAVAVPPTFIMIIIPSIVGMFAVVRADTSHTTQLWRAATLARNARASTATDA